MANFKFFKSTNIEDGIKEYKKLVRKYHPDFNPENADFCTKVMQELNAEYEKFCEVYKNRHKKANGEEYTTTEETEQHQIHPQKIMEIIQTFIVYDVDIDIIGSWAWITGNTYAIKDTLKEHGFRWASRKKAWYWHDPEEVCKGHGRMTLDEIKDLHGCDSYKGKSRVLLGTNN